jgi:transcriptional antiterminator RfaH
MPAQWFAFRSKPRKEDFLFDQLASHKVEAFAPFIRVKTVNPRARKIKPYFPGYLFVRVDLDEIGFSVLNWLPGGAGLVRFDGIPAPVPDALINAIRERVDAINHAGGEIFDDLHRGDRVRIVDGPFRDYAAIFDTRLSGSDRVRVLLQAMKSRLVEVDLPAGSIAKK